MGDSLDKLIERAKKSGRFMIGITYLDREYSRTRRINHHIVTNDFPADQMFNSHFEIEQLVRAENKRARGVKDEKEKENKKNKEE